MAKPAALSSALVARKGAAAPSSGVPARAAETPAASSTGRTEPLNFRVTADFRRRFKVYAAEHDLSQSDLLERAFEKLAAAEP